MDVDNVVCQPIISKRTLKRLPVYLNYLKRKKKQGISQISFPVIARDVELSVMQVKKDISAITTKSGKPKIGHNIDDLIYDIRAFLDYNTITKAVIIGVGSLGKALLSYERFKEYGVEIVAAFDIDEKVIDKKINNLIIKPFYELWLTCKREKIEIGIITANASSAQMISDELIKNGVNAIWNFAPTHIKTPDHVIVQNENMASNLAVLSRHLKENNNNN